MKLFVIILNWNGKNDTLACLRSLENHPHILVIDNGSHDDSVSEIQKHYPHISLIQTGLNLGYAGGNNVGIEAALRAGAEAVLILNNDTLATPHFIDALIRAASQSPDVGIWGGYPLSFYNPEYLDHLGGIWNPEKKHFDLIGLKEKRGFQTQLPLDYVCGCSMLIRREVFEKVGLLEPKFFLFWEEADFAMRAKKAGFSIRVCEKAELYHKVSASFTGGSPHKKYFWWRGRLLWMERNSDEKLNKFINKELYHYRKLYWIKRVELAILNLLRVKKIEEKQKKLSEYRAVIQGIRDFLDQKFDSGPSWLL